MSKHLSTVRVTLTVRVTESGRSESKNSNSELIVGCLAAPNLKRKYDPKSIKSVRTKTLNLVLELCRLKLQRRVTYFHQLDCVQKF